MDTNHYDYNYEFRLKYLRIFHNERETGNSAHYNYNDRLINSPVLDFMSTQVE